MAKCVQCGRQIAGFGFGKPVCKWCRMHAAAQRGEEPEDARQAVMPAPWVRRENAHFITKAIFGINVAVFLGMALAGISIMQPSSAELIAWGANWGPDTFGGQWWRLITYNFLHIGILHIALNMWCLWSLGELAESLYGSWMFAAVYMVCGISGGMLSKVWHFGGVSAGASGAIFGIAGALIASYKLGEFALPQAHIKATLSSIVSFAGYNLVLGAISGFTDNAAHIGGLVAGLIMGGLIAKAAPDSRQIVRRIVILLIVLAPVAAVGQWMTRTRGFLVHLYRGETAMEEHKPDQAINEFQAATRLQPNNFEAHFNLGRAYYDQKKYAEAQAEFRRSAELNRRDGRPYMGLGMAFHQQQNCAAAIQEYQTAISLMPNLESANYDLGLCYADLKRYDEAIAALQRELQVSGDDRRTLVALADAYDAKGMKKEADETRQKAAQLQLQNNED